jgi:hypothetical protein
MRVRLGVVFALSVLLAPLAVFGQTAAIAGSSSPTKPDWEKSVQIVIYAAAEAQPSLKYQLLPPMIERRPGNAAVWWNRLRAEQDHVFSELAKEGGKFEKIDAWMKIPLGDPREKRQRPNVSDIAGSALFSDMDRAARFESCDWELPFREGNVFEMLLPELQQTRMYARLLSFKARLEIAEGKYDQAIATLQTGFGLARDVATGQTLIHALVGTAAATMMTDRIQEMIQQPNSPNLYWALSTLPHPPVNFRPGLEAETSSLYLEIPELQGLNKKQMPSQQWRELLLKLISKLRTWGGTFPKESDESFATALSIQGYPQARQYLLEHGRSAAEVEAMPVAQVILLYTVQVFDELRDNQFKWLFLPYPEASKGLKDADRHLQESMAANREIIPIARLLLPAVSACRQAETKITWRIDQLRVAEALRMYAAANGRLPDRLDDITDVPIPVNPYDGKPFIYRRDGNKSVLTCQQSGPVGMPWQLEITLAEKGK